MNIPNFLKRKKEGMLDDFLPILIFILIAAVLLCSFVEYNKAVNQKTTVNSVARNYILKIETTGCMTDTIQSSLINSLENYGYKGDAAGGPITAANFNGTTRVDVGYGNDVCLRIKVYTTNTILSMTADEDGEPTFDLFAPKFVKSSYVPIEVTYYSTSKE